MEDSTLFIVIPMVYTCLLSLMLLPYCLKIGFRPIVYLMSFTHGIYAAGVFALYLLVMGTYTQIRNTEFGQRLENSIVQNSLSGLGNFTDMIQYRYAGENVVFYCDLQYVAIGESNVISWTHDAVSIKSEKVNKTYSVLVLENVKSEDFGVYMCRVTRNSPNNNSQSDVYKHPYKLIQSFYLKPVLSKTERVFIPPGGILQLQVNYHTFVGDEKSTIYYTINQKPIHIKNDRSLYTKCSFFTYNFWTLFQFGSLLYQLNVSRSSHQQNDVGITVIKASTNFCINDEFYGTYKFFVQSHVVDKTTGKTRLIDFGYPITYEIVPRTPNLFDNRYFQTSPSHIPLTTQTAQCWLNRSSENADYCDDILQMFQSVPALFFTIEAIIFLPSVYLAYVCFTWYVYLMNIGIIRFIIYMKLESPFQYISLHRRGLSLKHEPVSDQVQEFVRIFISYTDCDWREVRQLQILLEDILSSDIAVMLSKPENLQNEQSVRAENLHRDYNASNASNTSAGASPQKSFVENVENIPENVIPDNLVGDLPPHTPRVRKEDVGEYEDEDDDTPSKYVYTRNDAAADKTVMSGIDELIEKSNVFIIYATNAYFDSSQTGFAESELSGTLNITSNLPPECLLVLGGANLDLDKLISKPYVHYHWQHDFSDLAKRNTLKGWIYSVIQRNNLKIDQSRS